MDRIQVLEIPEVTFQPKKEPIVPNIPPDFPCVPSAKYYYISQKGDKVPMPNTIGTDLEKSLYLRIWYSMNGNDIFPLNTVYARTREDQINRPPLEMPPSQISLSMKSYLKQYEDSSDWFFDDRFQIIIGQMKIQSIDTFVNDFYRFPLNPSSDPFMVARLLETYIRDGDEAPLRRYLKDRGIFHLLNHPFGYYPIYYLFFLLTRFASYPFSEAQIQLAKRRLSTQKDSPAQVFIDSIFQYEIYNIPQVLTLIDSIQTQGPGPVGALFGTSYDDWYRWGNEYLQNQGKPAEGIENIPNLTYIIADKLYTWTDNDVDALCRRLKIPLPFRSEHPTRYSYITFIAGIIRRFRSDPADTAAWKDQVVKG
jgi:hypothetical protein